MARTMARRGLHLDPANERLTALAAPAAPVAPAIVLPGRAGRPNDRSDVIGEAGVSVSDPLAASGAALACGC